MSLDRPLLRFAILNETGDAYYKSPKYPQADGTYNIEIDGDPHYLYYPPIGWNKMEITWERNAEYLGVFRSLAGPFAFANDGYAIIRNIFNGAGGMRAKAQIRIDVRVDTESTPGAKDQWRYETFYQSFLNFEEYEIDLESSRVTVGILDSKLFTALKARAGTQFNIPYWNYDGTTWTPNCEFIIDDGIKLLWHSGYDSAATVANPLDYTGTDNTLVTNSGGSPAHTFPAFNQLQIIQNNGATTFIGNDILAAFLVPNNQTSEGPNETGFDNYSIDSYVIKYLGFSSAAMSMRLEGIIVGATVTYGRQSASDILIKFNLYEIDVNNVVTVNALIGQIRLPSGADGTATVTIASAGAFEMLTSAVTLSYNKVYAVGISVEPETGSAGSFAQLKFSSLSFSLFSNYNSGISGPVDAPGFPQSRYAAYRPFPLLQALVSYLPTVATDQNGFPVPVDTDFDAQSDVLNDTGAIMLDNTPYSTLFTSGNALRLINGQPYINMSLRDFHSCCRNMWGMGLGIEGDSYNIIRLEKLSYFFDNDTIILELPPDTISKPKITAYNEYLANNIKAGYSKVDTNNDFGVDAFCTEQDFMAPLSNETRDLNLIVPATADMYAKEKARVQTNTQPIQSPSSDNGVFLVEVDETGAISTTVENPVGAPLSVTGYFLKTYPTAQSTDPTAATAPYVYGLYYPDTAINLGITPAKNMLRNSPLLRSQLSLGSSDVLTFVKQYQMLYNNVNAVLPGISTNLNGTLINEVSDIATSTMDSVAGPMLYAPFVIEFTTTYPVNMYAIIQANPRGKIRAPYKGVIYEGFINKISQKIGSKAATSFALLAGPDMVI